MIKKMLLFIGVILVSLQIYGASSQTATESAKVSGKITTKIVEVITSIKKVETDEVRRLHEKVHYLIRKTAHFLEYALLSFLVFLLAKCYNIRIGVCIIISLGYCLLFAVVDEWHQLSVAGRSGEFRDVIIDFCGSVAGNGFGCLVMYFVKRMKRQKTI